MSILDHGRTPGDDATDYQLHLDLVEWPNRPEVRRWLESTAEYLLSGGYTELVGRDIEEVLKASK